MVVKPNMVLECAMPKPHFTLVYLHPKTIFENDHPEVLVYSMFTKI